MRFGKLSVVVLFILFGLNINCSNLLSEKKVSFSKIQVLHSRIKMGQFKEIYAGSSKSLRSRLSEKEFLDLMEQAVIKLKNVDETLSFQESSVNQVLPQLLDTEGFFSNYFEKIERDGKKLEIFSQWNKANDEDSFKLFAIVIVENAESGKPEFFYV